MGILFIFNFSTYKRINEIVVSLYTSYYPHSIYNKMKVYKFFDKFMLKIYKLINL